MDDAGWVVRVVEGRDVGRSRCLGGAPLTVGRDPAAELVLTDPSVSRSHAQLELVGGEPLLGDVGSSGGTFVSGERLTAPRRLVPGQSFEVGATKLRVLRRPTVQAGNVAQLVVRGGPLKGRRLTVRAACVLGRDPTRCDVVLDEPTVSAVHCQLEATDGGVKVTNLSRHGTSLNGRSVAGDGFAGPGDDLALGDVHLLVERADGTTLRDGSVEIDVLVEGERVAQSIRIDADPEMPVGDVAAAVARELGGPTTAGMLLYRPRDGLCPPESAPWGAIPVQRADCWVIGDADRDGPSDGAGEPAPALAYTELVPRHPRRDFGVAPVDVAPPPTPDDTTLRASGVPWQVAAGAASIIGSVVIAQLRPAYALFAYVMGVAGAFALLAGLLAQRSRRRHQERRFRQQLAELDGDLRVALADEEARARAGAPTTATMAQWVETRDDRLWERRVGDGDELGLRVGTADLPSHLTVRLDRWRGGHHRDALVEVVDRYRLARDVPVRIPGAPGAAIGVLGAVETVSDLGRSLIVQAAALHSPDEVTIAVLALGDQWRWARWLPHVSSPTGEWCAWRAEEVDRLLRALMDWTNRPDLDRAVHRLWLLVGPGLGARSDVRRVVAEVRAAGGVVVQLAVGRVELPGDLTALVDLSRALATYDPGGVDPIGLHSVERVSVDVAESLGRSLGRLVSDTAAVAFGRSVDALSLWGLDGVSAGDLTARWVVEPGLRGVTIGVDDGGEPVAIALTDGSPHGVLAGTTGSGKSELLKTLVAGFAASHAPAQLAMFLMDFKGGSTFQALAALPHVVGVVTDLEHDRSLVERAFQALDAEIMRRKTLLDEARVPDLSAYQRLPRTPAHHVPSLLVLIDEFALLKDLYPELLTRLDTISMQGRSLGIHLLLAAQDPQGVISQPIRTNTGVWLCLRVGLAEQSKALLGSDVAARIPIDAPGRGYLRLGADLGLRGFQTALISRPTGDHGGPVALVRRLDTAVMVPPKADVSRGDSVSGGRPTTELDVLVAAITDHARATAAWQPEPLWLAPLPERITLDELGPITPTERAPKVPIGLMDEPGVPRQLPYVLDLSAAGHVLAVGRLGAGKTTLLRTVAQGLATSLTPAEVHLYGLDAADGALASIERLPHCGAVIGAHDGERLARLVGRLRRELDARRTSMAADAARDFERWRTMQPEPPPWIVVLIDEVGPLRDLLEKHVDTALFDMFMAVVESGPGVGIHLVMTASQWSDVRSQIANLCGVRMAMQLTDPIDATFVIPALGRRDVVELPPGRAMVSTSPPNLVQLVDTDPDEALPDALASADTSRGARPVRRMPREIALADLPIEPGSGRLLIGAGGDEVEPVALRFDRDGPHLLVAGESGSGRTTVLVTVASVSRVVNPSLPILVLSPFGWTAPELVDRYEVDETGMLAALDELSADPRPALVLVDDADRLSRAVGERLLPLIRDAGRTGIRMVVAGRAVDVLRSYEDWLRYLTSLRVGLLLTPPPELESAFDLRPSRVRLPPLPGRGILVGRGTSTVVQVARRNV